MNLRILIPLIFVLIAGGTLYAQDPAGLQQSATLQTLAAQPESANVQSADPTGASRSDIFNPPSSFVAPPAKKAADEAPGDAPLLVPIEPAKEVPFDTAEYRSNKIPFEQYPTTSGTPPLR